MKQELQTQAQLGGEAQQTTSQAGGEAMRWKIEYVDYNYNAWEEGERLWKRLWELSKPELVAEIRENCSCEIPQHNDGGDYHYIWKIFRLDEDSILIVQNSTRMAFTPYEQGFIYVRHVYGDGEYAVWTETINDAWAEVYNKEDGIRRIEEIIEEYEVYVEGSLEF
jgi:hypothetical protein